MVADAIVSSGFESWPCDLAQSYSCLKKKKKISHCNILNFQTVGDDFETLLQCADAELQKNTAIAGVESGEYCVLFFSMQLP